MKLVRKKICLLGDFAVGKTSLIRRYVEGRFDDKYLSTIGVKISRKTLERGDHLLTLLIWDLAGGEEFKDYEMSYLQGASGALIVCDLTRHETLECLSSYAQQMHISNSSAPLVIVGNKIDLLDGREITDTDLNSVSRKINASYLLTSAKTGENVEECMRFLADLIERKNDAVISE